MSKLSSVVRVVSRLPVKKSSYNLARKILGKDFISPSEIARQRNLVYARRLLAVCENTLPSEEDLVWCCDNDMSLMAGPPTVMSLIDVRAVKPWFFNAWGAPIHFGKDWYDEVSESFARIDKIAALGWIAFRKKPVEDSLNKIWMDQQSLVMEHTIIPNVAEMAWAVTTYRDVRMTCLYENLYIRTNSIASDGVRVIVGNHDSIRATGSSFTVLYVSNRWNGDKYSNLGISVIRKF